MNFSEEWLQEYELKQRNRIAPVDPVVELPADEGPESDLLKRMMDWCVEHNLPHFHDRSRKKNKAGFVDLVIGFPRGVTLWAEDKSKTGRLSKEQKEWRRALLFLGHRWVEIRSFKQFLAVAVPLLGKD